VINWAKKLGTKVMETKAGVVQVRWINVENIKRKRQTERDVERRERISA